MDANSEELAIGVFRAVEFGARLRALQHLRHGPCSAGKVYVSMGSSPSRGSTHLSRLRSAKLVGTTRDGSRILYALSPRGRIVLDLVDALSKSD